MPPQPVYNINSVSPLTISNDQIVTVAFHSTNPSTQDWIAAFSPPPPSHNSIYETVPVKFGLCMWSSNDVTNGNYLATGAGSLAFNLTNLRADVAFYYLTGGDFNSSSVNGAVIQDMYASYVSFQNINQPLRNRVVPTFNNNIYNVLWSAASNAIPTLQWGLVSNSYSHFVSATVSNITRSSLCGAPANATGWRELGNIYTAPIEGINQLNLYGQTIYYIFGDASDQNWSDEVAFLVPPRAGTNPPQRGTRMVLMADMGVGSTNRSLQTLTWQDTGEASYNTTQSIVGLLQNPQSDIDAVVLAGDLSYADGYLANWDFFMDMIAPVAGSRLFLSQVGNHESDYPNTVSNAGFGDDSGGECSVVSMRMMPQPTNLTYLYTNVNAGSLKPLNSLNGDSQLYSEPWYSYDIGLVHFLSMSTEHNFTFGSKQYLFIENDLKSVNRTVTPWIIFSGHRPMYVDSDWCCQNDDSVCSVCDAGTDVGVMQELQRNIEPLLHKYGVQLGVTGHFHNVQRQAAVFANNVVQNATVVTDTDGNKIATHVNANATVWMVIGTAGQTPDMPTKFYSWSELALLNVNGYAVIEAVNASYLYWEWINSANNLVYDRMALIQYPVDDSSEIASNNGNSQLTTREISAIAVSVVALVACVAMCFFVRKLHSNRTVMSHSFSGGGTSPPSFSSSATTVNILIAGNQGKPQTAGDSFVGRNTQSFASAYQARESVINNTSIPGDQL